MNMENVMIHANLLWILSPIACLLMALAILYVWGLRTK